MKKNIKKLLCVLLCITSVFLLCSCESLYEYLDSDLSAEENSLPAPRLVSHFLDVGQGDSTFIQLPDGRTMLIDAGVTDEGDGIGKYISDLGCKRIDFLIATHPHSDHIGGMRRAIKELEVGEVYMPKVTADTFTYEKLLKELGNRGLKVKTAKAGVRIASSADPQYTVDLLAPCGDNYEGLNDYSAVVMIRYGGVSFLYTGDAELASETEMLKSGADLSADVVKIGHHGSSDSSCEEFVAAVGASYGVISCGENNDYGHPHKQALKRWEKAGTKLYRTDLNGTVIISSDGSEICVDTERQE